MGMNVCECKLGNGHKWELESDTEGKRDTLKDTCIIVQNVFHSLLNADHEVSRFKYISF